jgi:hypothetical protein
MNVSAPSEDDQDRPIISTVEEEDSSQEAHEGGDLESDFDEVSLASVDTEDISELGNELDKSCLCGTMLSSWMRPSSLGLFG